MTPREQALWLDISQAIEPYCVDGAQYIKDYYEHEHCAGFDMTTKDSELLMQALHCTMGVSRFNIEEDLRIFNKDRPGEFEGMPND